MTALSLGDVADGPVTMRVGGSEPFTFEVLGGLADVPDQFAAFVAAQFGAAAPAPDLGPAGPQEPPPAPPAPEEFAT